MVPPHVAGGPNRPVSSCLSWPCPAGTAAHLLPARCCPLSARNCAELLSCHHNCFAARPCCGAPCNPLPAHSRASPHTDASGASPHAASSLVASLPCCSATTPQLPCTPQDAHSLDAALCCPSVHPLLCTHPLLPRTPQDPAFRAAAAQRFAQLRAGVWTDAAVAQAVSGVTASVHDALLRTFQRSTRAPLAWRCVPHGGGRDTVPHMHHVMT